MHLSSSQRDQGEVSSMTSAFIPYVKLPVSGGVVIFITMILV